MWRVLEADPLFQRPRSRLSMDEQRHLAARQMYRVKQYNFLPFEEMIEDTRKVSKSALNYCTGLQEGKLLHFHYGNWHWKCQVCRVFLCFQDQVRSFGYSHPGSNVQHSFLGWGASCVEHVPTFWHKLELQCSPTVTFENANYRVHWNVGQLQHTVWPHYKNNFWIVNFVICSVYLLHKLLLTMFAVLKSQLTTVN